MGWRHAIANADGETSLDLQTVAAVAPNAQLRLVQSTDGGGALARSLQPRDRRQGGTTGCHDPVLRWLCIAEAQASPQFLETINNVLGDGRPRRACRRSSRQATPGSTTCERRSRRLGAHRCRSRPCPRSSPPSGAPGSPSARQRAGGGETVWNDTPYGAARRRRWQPQQARARAPTYQKQASSAGEPRRARRQRAGRHLARVAGGHRRVAAHRRRHQRILTPNRRRDGTGGGHGAGGRSPAAGPGQRLVLHRVRPSGAPSSTSSKARTTSTAWAAAPRALVTTPPAASACPTGRRCPAPCPPPHKDIPGPPYLSLAFPLFSHGGS